MLTALEKMIKEKVATQTWQEKLHEIALSYGTKLNGSPESVAKEWAYTSEVLQLSTPPKVTTQTGATDVAPAASAPVELSDRQTSLFDLSPPSNWAGDHIRRRESLIRSDFFRHIYRSEHCTSAEQLDIKCFTFGCGYPESQPEQHFDVSRCDLGEGVDQLANQFV